MKFTKDEMIVPKDSEWFGEYPTNNATYVIPMEETDLYKEVCEFLTNYFVLIEPEPLTVLRHFRTESALKC